MSEQDFDDTGMPPTMEQLAEHYSMPGLTRLYNEKAQKAVLLRGEMSIEIFGIDDANCRIEFTQKDYIRFQEREGFLKGFEISLINEDTDEVIVRAVHAEDPDLEDRFNITAGDMPENCYDIEDATPASLMQGLTGMIVDAMVTQPEAPANKMN